MYGQLACAGTGTTNKKGTATRPAPATIVAVSSSTSLPPLIIAFQDACSSAASSTASVISKLNAWGSRRQHCVGGRVRKAERLCHRLVGYFADRDVQAC